MALAGRVLQPPIAARNFDGRLVAADLDRVVSSPFRRAQDSVAPLAARRGLPIDIDDRLAERLLGGGFDDWRKALRATLEDPYLCFDGGECSAAAMTRGAAALRHALYAGGVGTAIVTHGNLLTLLLRHFDSRTGYAEWEALINPDVYRVTVTDGGAVTERIWR